MALFRLELAEYPVTILGRNSSQYYAKELKAGVDAHRNAHPKDKRIAVIDLGPGVAKNLAVKNGVMGGLHPNDRGHANFPAAMIPQVLAILGVSRK